MTKQSKTKPKDKPAKRKEKAPTDKLADRTTTTKILQGIFGDAQKKILRRMYKQALNIGKLEPKYEQMSDKELQEQSQIFRDKIKQSTKTPQAALDEILPDAFAVAREASKRVLKMRPYDVQLIGGIALHEGNVAEMKTGEGKTLVAMLPAYLNGLTGEGVHIVTVNDYLAQRDARLERPSLPFSRSIN